MDQNAKVPQSSIKLVSQAVRQSMQVQTKAVPRPKGMYTVQHSGNHSDYILNQTSILISGAELGGDEVSDNAKYASPISKATGSGKKLVTQGEADNLTLNQMKEHTTLNFEINRAHKKKKKRSSKTSGANF